MGKTILQIPIRNYNIYIIDIDQKNNIIKYKSGKGDLKQLIESQYEIENDNVYFDNLFCSVLYIEKFINFNR